MASAQKRGKTWQYTVSRMVDGKPKPIRKSGFRTKKEALIAAAEIENQLKQGLDPSSKPVQFARYFRDWYELYKVKLATRTIERYEDHFNALLQHFGNTAIQDVSSADYQKFLNVFGQTRTTETVRKLHNQVRNAVLDAVDEGIIRVDFTRKADPHGDKPAKSEDEKYMNYMDTRRVIRRIHHLIESGQASKSHYMILLALTGGFRYGEMASLQVDDFSFVRNEIMIDKAWNMKDFCITTTKNKTSNRIVTMDEKTMVIFKKYIETEMPKNEEGFLFFSAQSRGKILTNASVNKTLTKILNDLQVDQITLHGCRHTHASILLYQKVSVNYVSERLGHSNVDTTLRHYSHVLKEMRTEETALALKTIQALAV